jgi:hypothetical protein
MNELPLMPPSPAWLGGSQEAASTMRTGSKVKQGEARRRLAAELVEGSQLFILPPLRGYCRANTTAAVTGVSACQVAREAEARRRTLFAPADPLL